MRIRHAAIATLSACVLMASAASAFAQPGKARVAGGLSFLRDSEAAQTAVGIAADVVVNFLSNPNVNVGVVGDVGVNSFDGCSEKSFAAGGRVTGSSGKISPFGQFLFGRVSCGPGGSNTIWQPGFGIDIGINNVLAVRGQVDIRSIRFGDGVSLNEQRFWFGVSIKVGS